MANNDNPNGFKALGHKPRLSAYTAKDATDIERGDLLAIVSGRVLPWLETPHTDAVGVAATAATGGDEVLVYDDPTTEFYGQTAGSYAPTSHDGLAVDATGTTGEMEVHQGSTTKAVVVIKRQYLGEPGSTDTGANARVVFQINKHALVA